MRGMTLDATPVTGYSRLLLHAGRVFTGEHLHPTATAVLIQDGLIQRVGTDAELWDAVGDDVHVVNVRGGLITPGFVDAHIHAIYGGVESNTCDMSQAASRAETLETIRRYTQQNPPSSAPGSDWIFGGGWYTGNFPSGTPTAVELDAVTGDRPAYLINADHHSVWVNTAALRLAEVTAATADPDDGVVERDATGAPIGILHEGAMDLVGRVLTAQTPEELAAGLAIAADYLKSVGVTGWQEAILGDYAGYHDASAVYREARQTGTIQETTTGALWVPRDVTLETVPELVAEFLDRREANAAAGFTTRTAKIMVDGVPENRTAAMLEGYCQCDQLPTRPTAPSTPNRGLTYLDYDVIRVASAALDQAGFDLHFHAIGDRAVRWALDAVEEVRSSNPTTDGRHHIAHIQVVNPDDLQRFKTTGATANIQALWACNDPQMIDHTIPQLGDQRTQWQYPFASISEAGGKLCMGSDWPVSTPDPWQAIHVAVNRIFPHVLDQQVATNPALVPSEALDLHTALRAYTAGSAWQLRLDDDYGRIEPGAVATLAVADRNPFDDVVAGDPLKICTTQNILTLVSGKVVYDGR